MTAVRRAWLRLRIAAVKAAILDSLTNHPDNFDARDKHWQRLHRLQSQAKQLGAWGVLAAAFALGHVQGLLA